MEIVENLELCHHGIQGMKWGIRRYQNKDGSLTKAGLKRYNQEMDKAKAEAKVLSNRKRTATKLEKLNNLKKKNDEEKAALDGKKMDENDPKKKTELKSISQMTDEELFNYKQRLQLEKDTYDLQRKVSELNPPKETATKRLIEKAGPLIADKLWNDVAKPSLNKYLEDKFKTPPGELEALEKQSRIWKAKADIARNKKNYGDDVEKREQAEKRRVEEARVEKETQRREADARRQVDDYVKSGYKDDRVGSSTYSKTGDGITDNKVSSGRGSSNAPRLEQVERVKGTVEGEGTSRFDGWKKKTDDIVVDFPNESRNDQKLITSGQNMVERYGRYLL